MQFGFGEGHLTSYALVDLNRSTYKSFKKNKFILDVLIDVLKAFDTV